MKEYNNFKIILEPKESRNYLITIAIGDKYYNSWEKAALPLWLEYCKNNDLGIIVFFDELVPKDYPVWKKATWQKLVIGTVLKENEIDVENICYIDTDILINPCSPNVFQDYDKETIGLVSRFKNIPQPLDETKRRLAFLRHTNYDDSYPLDSALFMSIEQHYTAHDMKPQDDFFCAGFFIFNLDNHSDLMKQWFDKYPSNVESMTSGGDQTHVNYEFLNWGNVSWLDYRFQAIWVYETAWKYPFLYSYGRNNKELIKECIEASLYSTYFLHFAGSWHESDMWEMGGFLEDKKQKSLIEYNDYTKTPVTGNALGMIKPKND